MSGGVFVHAPHMLPELLITVLSLDRLPREVLLFADLFQMQIPRPIQAMIPHKDRLDESPMLPDGNHREIFDVQIDADGDQIGVLLALDHLFRFDGFGLGKVQLGALLAQHQLGAFLLP